MRTTPSRPILRTVFIAIAFAGALAVRLDANAQTPSHAKVYATEQLSSLSVADQRRVIAESYRDQSGGRSIPDDQMRFYLDQVRLSNWTFSQVQRDIADSLSRSGANPTGTDGVVRCESDTNRPQSCTTGWNTTSRLVRQLSGAPCIEGQTWSSSPGLVWVNNGCRAEFSANWSGTNASTGDSLRCESTNNRQQSCPTPWNTSSRLVRQLSGAPCVENQSWWSGNGQVTVSGGCRAEFAAGWADTGSNGNTIRCESGNNRARVCATPWDAPSRMTRQLSGSACIEGRTWFSSRGQVRVSGGCRAEFAPAMDNNGGYGTGTDITCESDGGRYRQCGSGLYGDVQLIRQTSGSACVEGRTWGLRDGAIWVDGGCRGVFRVYNNSWGGQGGTDSVTCASRDGRHTSCAWDSNRGWPQLLQQLSDSPCIQGRTWGYDRRNGLWVDGGCRGRFGVR